MDFNETKASYRSGIEQTLAFAGQGLDFYTNVKARYFQKIIKRELAGITRPNVLDVGCGHGYIHPSLLRFGYDVVGVEVANEVLAIAREANPGVVYIDYDGAMLPFSDESFDAVMTICVMHHVPPDKWQRFSNELHRVLRRGGVAVIFEHNPINPLTQYVVRSNAIDADAILLSTRTTRGLLREAGFSSVRTRNILFTPFAHSFFRTLDEKLGWCPLGAQYYAVGRKL